MAEIQLSCQPGKDGKFLVFPYRIQNGGGTAVYVMEAVASVAGDTRLVTANPQAVVVMHGPDDDATLGKFIAPLPLDRRMAVPVVPLARHLPPGGTLEGRVQMPMPLAETSPYFADLPLRQYDIVDINGVVFTIGYWLAGTDALAAIPADYAPELFIVATRNTARSARQVSCRFPTRSLQLFKRTDRFPRTTAAEPAVAGGPATPRSGSASP